MIFFIVVGFFEPRAVVFAVFCMAGPIISALLGFKRGWCKYFCPRGIMYEEYFKKSRSRKVPSFLMKKWFKLLMIICIFGVLGLGVYKNVKDPYAWGVTLHRMIIVTTAVGIILSFRFNCRTWCSFCPMGSIANLIIDIQRRLKS